MWRMTFRAIALAITFSCALFVGAGAAELTDDEVKAAIIEESIQVYPGNCPCPYNVDRAGRRCGGRSAWSKPGGAAPLCYPADVTPEMIRDWRAKSALVKA
jgi:hypothetical protein